MKHIEQIEALVEAVEAYRQGKPDSLFKVLDASVEALPALQEAIEAMRKAAQES